MKLNLSLNEVIEPSLKEYSCFSQSIKLSLIDFMIDKLKYILSDKNYKIYIVNSVLNTKIVNHISIKVISSRIDSISKFTKIMISKFF